jgi:GNAT superfamily N-acetyltransferase
LEIRTLNAAEIAQAEAIDGIDMPDGTLFIGAIEDGEIVGRIMMLSLVHLEGTWVHERYRGGTLAARLVKKAEEGLRTLGVTHVIAYTPESNPKIGEYMQRFGYTRFPVTTWQKPLNGG